MHLYERCFFTALAYLKQDRRTCTLFDGDPRPVENELGLVSRNDLFRDGD